MLLNTRHPNGEQTLKIPEPTNTTGKCVSCVTKRSTSIALLTSVTTQLHHERSISYREDGGISEIFLSAWSSELVPGVAMPPAAKLTTGSRFSLAVSLRRWKGARISFA